MNELEFNKKFPDLKGMPVRLQNALVGAGFTTKKQIKKGLVLGVIAPYKNMGYGVKDQGIPGMGKKTYGEVLLKFGVMNPAVSKEIKDAINFLKTHGYKVSKSE